MRLTRATGSSAPKYAIWATSRANNRDVTLFTVLASINFIDKFPRRIDRETSHMRQTCLRYVSTVTTRRECSRLFCTCNRELSQVERPVEAIPEKASPFSSKLRFGSARYFSTRYRLLRRAKRQRSKSKQLLIVARTRRVT